MVSILQFWMDETSIADGKLFGGWVHLVSALVEYVMDTINLGLEEGYKVTWDQVMHHTPWMNFSTEEALNFLLETTDRDDSSDSGSSESDVDVLSLDLPCPKATKIDGPDGINSVAEHRCNFTGDPICILPKCFSCIYSSFFSCEHQEEVCEKQDEKCKQESRCQESAC